MHCSSRTRTAAILFATFIVALCSLVYELLFSQMLTVVFGGTVARYSVTIGLFLFSLGIGALLYRYIKQNAVYETFVIIEIALSVAGCAGVAGIVYLETLSGEFWDSEFGYLVSLILSHLPIVVVGILSGLEIPLLSSVLSRGQNSFAEVLGVDYFGGLIGTLIYALLLFPAIGLFATTLVTAFLNSLVAVGFAAVAKTSKVSLLCSLSLTAILLLAIRAHEDIDAYMNRIYMKSVILGQYTNSSASLPSDFITINEAFTTPYQQVVQYDVKLSSDGRTDRCLNLDQHIQMCDGWYRQYHQGLIDVPMQLFDPSQSPRVLVLGGGDFIAVNFLKRYNVDVDLVDIDEEFQHYSRTNDYILEKNERAFRYDQLTIFKEDAFTYVKNNATRYDLILFDLPGIKHDKLSHLYSVEFFNFLRARLTPGGAIALWAYMPENLPAHHKTLMTTLRESGFYYYKPYTYFTGSRNKPESGQLYYLLSPSRADFTEKPKSLYYSTYSEHYASLEWQPIDPESSVRPHSIFRPNYDIVVPKRIATQPALETL